MSDQGTDRNVTTVRAVFRAAGEGDEAGMLRHLDPEIEWRPTGFLTGKRAYRGHDGIRQWIADLEEVAGRGDTILTFPLEYRALDDDRVLVLGRGRLERKVSPIDQELGWVWELRDGKVIRMTNYLSHAEARQAAGVGAE